MLFFFSLLLRHLLPFMPVMQVLFQRLHIFMAVLAFAFFGRLDIAGKLAKFCASC